MKKPTPKYVMVENRIRKAIKNGEIVDKLPGERVLAREYGVSYMTLRKAVDNLVGKRILYRIPARGTYVDQRKTVRGLIRQIGGLFEARAH